MTVFAKASESSKPRRWVVYSTFHPLGESASYCEDQLEAYREIGFGVVVVDSSPVVKPEREACWHRVATHWLRRENVGYDFGSYSAGLNFLTKTLGVAPESMAVVVANDSCYGPFTPLGELISSFDSQPTGERRVFGITDSLYFFRHLQSYWIYFRPEVAPLAASFFASLPTILDRESAVQHGELGLSRFLIDHRCKLVVPHSSEQLVERFRTARGNRFVSFLEFGIRKLLKRPRYTRNGDGACLRSFLGMVYQFNPTAAFGVEMHVRGMSPFIKRQLLRENPNADRLVPVLAEEEVLSNEKVFRAIRQTTLFRKRYGALEAARPYRSHGSR